jgi:glycosyltransferase involved in cell wall biosynthesis
MKIGLDIRNLTGNKTGKAFYLWHILKNLTEIDFKNQYLLYTQENFTEFKLPKNFSVKVIKAKSLLWHFAVIRDLGREKADGFFAVCSLIIPAFLPRNIKSFICIHDIVSVLFPQNHNFKAVLIENLLLKKALKKSTHIFTVSKHTASDLQKHFGIAQEKISIAYAANAQEQSMHTQNSVALLNKILPKKNPFILAVGTLEPRKNLILLITAFEKLSIKFPELRLVLAGGSGWKNEALLERIKQNPKIISTGYLSNEHLATLYASARCFVFPSLYEGFGIPILEAMSFGCPVITSNQASMPEVAGEAALYIDPANSNDLAAKIDLLLSDEPLRKKLIQLAHQQVKKFSWKKTATEVLRVFNNFKS